MLTFSGLAEDEIRVYDIEIYDQVTIHVIEVGFEVKDVEKPKMLVVHGFASSGAQWFATMKSLAQNFHVYFIDQLGMGSSSRQAFNATNHIEAEEILVDYLEKVREVLDLTDLILVGHSYGGFQVGLYASQYHQHVKKVIFVSPIGFMHKPEGFALKKIRSRRVIKENGKQVGGGGFSKIKAAVVRNIWRYQASPQYIASKLG